MQIPDLSDIPELIIAVPGEYELHIAKVMEAVSKNKSRKGVNFICEVTSEENVETIFHTLWYPKPDDIESTAITMLRMLKEFIIALNFDPAGNFDAKDMEGTSFTAILDTEEYNGKDKNIIKRVV